ncbi:glycosyltransferase family 4 protein [Mucilaginibacter sp. Bleaf8]|uniref:glycosyltransferase family 4 protein n=1 Tax=Mucilaginibacter sp. Bleaf8 TaxID=2834430 RepID=UPI001BD16F57|nr:glycosyltransferase family 1 protein [Mucilaginibacter sp. Bleaf8]MBS7567021.1 glycosyltransferase family 4 protein [Mucilaginibacter sp. Bleaf8]
MKIGYDAKRAFLNNTGLGNYSRWLIKVMATYYPEHRYYLYTPQIKPNSRLDFLARFKNLQSIVPSSKLLSSWWRSSGIVKDLKRDEIELYHGLSHELPFGIRKSGSKAVLTVHDLIFLRFPQYYSWFNRKIYTAKLRYACKAANSIIAISQRTKDDLVELLHVSPTKIEVIYQGCDPAFSLHQHEAHKKSISKKYNLPKKFLLCVGTIEERKNLLVLVKALLHTRISMPLVVVGKPTPYLEKVKAFIDANQLTSRVQFYHEVSFAELPTLYQLATAFVYPSRYEGFGIPVLEALKSGVPVIAASGSCLEEAGGPDGLYFSPDDEQELAKKINQLWSSPPLRQQMIIKGFEYGHNFDDEKLAGQLMDLYQKTITHA